MSGRTQKGGLFPEDRRRTRPVSSEHAPVRLAENGRGGLRSLILKLLQRSNFQAVVTDSCTVKTAKGPRQYVYPEGWPDITAAIPVTGRLWVIEIKTEDGAVRPAQEDTLLELTASGALVTLARSVEDVSEELKRQIGHLWEHHRAEYQAYLRALQLQRQAAAERAAEREQKAGRLPGRPRNTRKGNSPA